MGYDIPRYLMVTCDVCDAIKCVDRPCHYCGAALHANGVTINRAGRIIARANGHNIMSKIRKVAHLLGLDVAA